MRKKNNLCHLKSIINLFLILCLLFTTTIALGNITDQQIKALLQSAPQHNLSQRIDYFSAIFLTKPYFIEPLGEGFKGEFNQEPLYRLDGFDCQTFVETVIALSLAHNLNEFKTLMNQIRYANGIVDFTKRNHFPSADWLPNNAKAGFIEDITAKVAGKKNTATTTVYINRQQWYQHLSPERIKIPNLTAEQTQLKLAQLQAQGQTASNTWASVDYIPRNRLLINNKPNTALLASIPNGSIIMIIHHAPTEKIIGTAMNITHMGFAIWKDNQLYFRAASTESSSVTSLNLANYVRSRVWIKGISIWQLRPLSFTS